MAKPIRIALIYGSTREGRFCDTIIRWAAREIDGHEAFELDVIDPSPLFPNPANKPPSDSAANDLQQRLDRADAFVVATPEYNHSFSAPLKHLLDSIYGVWQAKPVAFISYGGVSGGLRAVEQLRLVFAELHAATIRQVVSFPNAPEQFDEQGYPRDPERTSRNLTKLLAQLWWWANALWQARQEEAYAGVS